VRSEFHDHDLEATLGTPLELHFSLHNDGEVIDAVSLGCPEVRPGWFSVPDQELSLFPGASVDVVAHLTLPEHFPAGDYFFPVHVTSGLDGATTVHQCAVRVPGVTRAELQLRPALVTAGRRGRFEATVTNTGNRTVETSLSADDVGRELCFEFEPPFVTVPPGQVASVAVRAIGRRPLFGMVTSHSLTVLADGPGVELAAAATFNQKPWIPRGAATVGVLAAIVALWATIFTVGIGTVTAAEAHGKAIPETFLSGQLGLDRAAVSGSLSGTVFASSTDAGLGRVTIEAFRVGRAGTELVASAASAADGSFKIEGLLPGRYLVRFSAAGFIETWFGAGGAGVPSQDAAEPVAVQPAAETADIAARVPGEPGSISGSVSMPLARGRTTPVTVRIRQKLGDTLGRAVEVTTDATGFFTASGLPTPGTYQLSFRAEGFNEASIEETLAGGENLVVNTVRLGAGEGAIRGIVRDANGPLGGVAVTVTRGNLTLTTTTPTAGQVGVYEVTGLETPGTYVVSYALDGFGPQTIALDLAPGERRSAVDMTLQGGTGTLRGLVRDGSGAPLGGVTVAVASTGFTSSTQTLTAGATGTYAVANLPTPGRYTVTFSAEGYRSETRELALGTSGTATGFDVTLQTSIGSITGTVTRAGVPTGGILVTVSDGVTARTTSTASSPAGAYRVSSIAAGSYTVTFSLAGTDSYTALVEVTAGETVDVSADLAGPAPPITAAPFAPATTAPPATPASAPPATSATAAPTSIVPAGPPASVPASSPDAARAGADETVPSAPSQPLAPPADGARQTGPLDAPDPTRRLPAVAVRPARSRRRRDTPEPGLGSR